MFFLSFLIQALSSLQNGKLPTFLESAVVDELFNNTDSNSICITNLRQGMDALGFYSVSGNLHLKMY